MTYTLIPFMILPVYSAVSKMDIAEGFEILLAFDIKPLDLIKDEGFRQSLDVSLNGLGGRLGLAAAVFPTPGGP